MARSSKNDHMEMARAFVAMKNAGASNVEIARLLGVNARDLSKAISKLAYLGVLRSHVAVALEALGQPITVTYVLMKQKVRPEVCIANVPFMISFVGWSSRPWIVAYVSASPDELEERLSSSMCSARFVVDVKKTLIPVEGKDGTLVDDFLAFDEIVGGTPRVHDYVDGLIAVELFREFNPPPPGVIRAYSVVKNRMAGPKPGSVRKHFYEHVKDKVAVERWIVRDCKRYAIMVFHARSLTDMIGLFRDLSEVRILCGIDHVSILNVSPLFGVSHVWVREEALRSSQVFHEPYDYVSYEILLVDDKLVKKE
ncbi:MAG: hypothetical protein ABWK00_04910 [Desulfurococcaceae archaeon]